MTLPILAPPSPEQTPDEEPVWSGSRGSPRFTGRIPVHPSTQWDEEFVDICREHGT